jgi:hypothetical protein
MRVKNADKLFEKMEEGRLYRREELSAYSKSVDRELKQLLTAKKVRKAAPGVYYRPEMTRFGPVGPDDKEVVRAFLKTDDFLLTSLNYFNGLAVGLTQLTNEMVVYNRKRVGKFKLNGMVYYFQRPPNFPKPTETNEEYLFVDLLNNYDNVYEAPDFFDRALKRKANSLRRDELLKAASLYAKSRANKMLKDLLNNG